MNKHSEAEAAGMRYVPRDAPTPRQQAESLQHAADVAVQAFVLWCETITKAVTPMIERMNAIFAEYEANHGRCAECDQLFCGHRSL